VFDVPDTRLIGRRGAKASKSWPPNTQIVSLAGVFPGTVTSMVMDAVGGWVCPTRRRANRDRKTHRICLLNVSDFRILRVVYQSDPSWLIVIISGHFHATIHR
jgi:hypothetical protein